MDSREQEANRQQMRDWLTALEDDGKTPLLLIGGRINEDEGELSILPGCIKDTTTVICLLTHALREMRRIAKDEGITDRDIRRRMVELLS